MVCNDNDVMLEISGLTKTYGQIAAVQDVDLSVAAGRLVGFVGPNGAGKSTTMRSVMRLVKPDAGTITWNGEVVDSSVLSKTGYLPEQRGLYPKMAIAEQVAYFAQMKGLKRRDARDRAEKLLGELGLGDRLGDHLQKLSHGNQQRVQLAVALACDPELLILDEPFNGLDPVAATTLQRVLEERVRNGAAVLFSSHQLDLVERVCDEVAIIVDGRIEAIGTVDAVKAERGHRRAVIRVDDQAIPLVEALEGFQIESHTARSATITLESDRDLEALLAKARRAGPVVDLRYELPPLGELFADLVAGPGSNHDSNDRDNDDQLAGSTNPINPEPVR